MSYSYTEYRMLLYVVYKLQGKNLQYEKPELLACIYIANFIWVGNPQITIATYIVDPCDHAQLTQYNDNESHSYINVNTIITNYMYYIHYIVP